MAKAVLFYALVSGWHPHGEGHGFRILAVTSEKGRQLYGRDLDTDAVTHRAVRDVIHRFVPGADEAFVRGAHDRATKTRNRMMGVVRDAETRARRLRADMGAAILRAAAGGQP